jgi:hypothetical protein
MALSRLTESAFDHQDTTPTPAKMQTAAASDILPNKRRRDLLPDLAKTFAVRLAAGMAAAASQTAGTAKSAGFMPARSSAARL